MSQATGKAGPDANGGRERALARPPAAARTPARHGKRPARWGARQATTVRPLTLRLARRVGLHRKATLGDSQRVELCLRPHEGADHVGDAGRVPETPTAGPVGAGRRTTPRCRAAARRCYLRILVTRPEPTV